MKKLLLIFLLLGSLCANAQLTLSEKSSLAENASFRSRIYQGLFSKANYWVTIATPINLMQQKQINYGKYFIRGAASSIDINVISRDWLSNYNVVPDLIGQPSPLAGQPSDDAILNTSALDFIYNVLANVVPGDDLLPVQP